MKKNKYVIIILSLIMMCAFFACQDKLGQKFVLQIEDCENGYIECKYDSGIFLDKDSIVELTAKPNKNYKLEKWVITGAEIIEGSLTSETIKLKIIGNENIYAIFIKETHRITIQEIDDFEITSDPKIPDSGVVDSGTEITFTATRENTSTGTKILSNWKIEGSKIIDEDRAKSQVTVKIIEDTTVSAEFGESKTVTLSTSVDETVLPVEDMIRITPKIPENNQVGANSILTVNASKKDLFEKWVIDGSEIIEGSETSNEIKIKITDNATIKANLKKLSVSITKPQNGSITPETHTQVDYGTEITFTATPDDAATYGVGKWSITGGKIVDGDINGSAIIKVKITGDATISVPFVKAYSVNITQPASGSITVKPELLGNKKVGEGAVLTLKATPPASQRVGNWSFTGCTLEKGYVDTNETIKVKVNDATEISITFRDFNFNNLVTDANFAEVEPKVVKGYKLSYGVPNTVQGVFVEGRTVKLSPYSISKYETTYELWEEVYQWAIQNGYTFLNAGKKGSSGNGLTNEPVTNMGWQDAIVWCNALTEKTLGSSYCVYRSGDDDSTIIKDANNAIDENLSISQMKKNIKKTGYRLPTEAEWMYAARYTTVPTHADEYDGGLLLTKINAASGATVDFNNENDTMEYGWLKKNSNKTTHPVGGKKANSLGIYDMTGNVLELCYDWAGSSNANDDVYKNTSGQIENPIGATKEQSKVYDKCYGGAKKVIRSCSYNMMTSVTCMGHIGRVTTNGSSNYIGFRIVKTK